MNHELAKTLSTALVQFIDRERPEGTMCCSNTDCANLENAFNSENFVYVEAYIKMKLSGGLTEFESSLRQIIEVTLSDEVPNGSGGTMSWAVALSDDDIKKLAPKVLALAKKEMPLPEDTVIFQKGVEEGRRLEREESHENYVRGYANGYKDAEKQYNESVAYHFPIMPTPPSGWGCDGTHCTNPHHDCINCPVQYSSGGTITTPNTASGTSIATLHGNTSATDGKEHNPSFTD